LKKIKRLQSEIIVIHLLGITEIFTSKMKMTLQSKRNSCKWNSSNKLILSKNSW